MPTPAERRALDRLKRAVSLATPDLAAAILRAVARLQQTPVAAIERALLAGGAEEVIAVLFSEAQVNAALADARRELIAVVDRSGRSALANALPSGAVSGIFDILAPQVLTSVQNMATRALGQFPRDVADLIRQEATRGIVAGENPRTTARRIRDFVGLAPNQADAVANFRGALEVGDVGKALGYKLRDRRFDSVIKRMGDTLSADQIDRMTDAYQRRFVAFHAETIARTTALDANKLGQELAFEQAAESGVLDTDRLVKRWVTTLDGRERETHAEMDGVEVPYDEPWIVPDAGPQMYPGEGEYNCRCAQVFRLLPRR
jgi:hypothetical protein